MEGLVVNLLGAVAEDIGVCAEPEVEVQQLSSEHPFMVIASDGVFEFLTNQEVINMVSPFSEILREGILVSDKPRGKYGMLCVLHGTTPLPWWLTAKAPVSGVASW